MYVVSVNRVSFKATNEVSSLSEKCQKKEAELQKLSNTHERMVDELKTGIAGAANEKVGFFFKSNFKNFFVAFYRPSPYVTPVPPVASWVFFGNFLRAFESRAEFPTERKNNELNVHFQAEVLKKLESIGAELEASESSKKSAAESFEKQLGKLQVFFCTAFSSNDWNMPSRFDIHVFMLVISN